MTLHVKVKPNSKVDLLAYDDAGNLTVKIKAPAQDGKANEYLVKYLAGVFGISRSKVQLVSGFTNPHKKLEIDAEETEIRRILQEVV